MSFDALQRFANPSSVNPDIFRLKDDAFEDSANLQAPGIIASDNEVAPEQFETVEGGRNQ